jgi:hypothetical protein
MLIWAFFVPWWMVNSAGGVLALLAGVADDCPSRRREGLREMHDVDCDC